MSLLVLATQQLTGGELGAVGGLVVVATAATSGVIRLAEHMFKGKKNGMPCIDHGERIARAEENVMGIKTDLGDIKALARKTNDTVQRMCGKVDQLNKEK